MRKKIAGALTLKESLQPPNINKLPTSFYLKFLLVHQHTTGGERSRSVVVVGGTSHKFPPPKEDNSHLPVFTPSLFGSFFCILRVVCDEDVVKY